MKILFNIIFYTIILVCLGVTSQASSAEKRTVKVGCLYPITGPAGLYGRDSSVAIQMAQDHIRSLEPADYPELDIQIEDTRSRSLRSVQIARKFIKEDQVDFLCGVVGSNIARAVSTEAAKNKTFFIGTDHASPALVSKARHPHYFRLNNGSRQSMLAGAKYIKEHLQTPGKPLKIAFIGPDYEYGYRSWDDLRSFLHKEGVKFEVTSELWPKLFETDYNIYIQQLLQSESDIVVNGNWGLDFVTFVKQAGRLGLFEKTKFANFDAAGNYGVFAALGNEMPIGLILSGRHYVNWPSTENNRKFVQEFFDRAGRYPSYAAQGAYSGILAIAEAVHEAGGIENKEKVRLALEQLKISLPEDPEGFKSFMDPKSHQLMQVQAIGITQANQKYPPATTQLGNWSVYPPPKEWPALEKIEASND